MFKRFMKYLGYIPREEVLRVAVEIEDEIRQEKWRNPEKQSVGKKGCLKRLCKILDIY